MGFQIFLQLRLGQDGNPLELRPDQAFLDIERRRQFDAAFGKAEVVHQRMSDVANADQNRPVTSVHSED